MNLNSLFLRWIARNSDALVAFVVGLDAKLDEILKKYDADVAAFEEKISNITDETNAQIDALNAQAAESIKAVEAEAAERAKAAKILFGLKSALPTE